MKNCPKCNSQHNLSGIYCCRSCANSRIFTEQSRKKKSDSNKKYWNALSDSERKNKIKILSEISPKSKSNHLENTLTQDWNVLGIMSKRLRVILEQNGKCNKCGITHWMTERITLEYEHKDGDNSNNSRDNVEALCPNCHSQTKTWRGRKNGKKQKRVEEFLNLLD
jgi:hypothetical protein